MLTCHMTFQNFPMDVQSCGLIIESFAYDIEDVQFEWLENDGINVRKIVLPQHKLEGLSLNKCVCARGSFSCIEAKFYLSRQMGYYIIQAYVPTTLIVMLSWISFWISITATPARVSVNLHIKNS